jgi:FkbM family methyltransferase
VLQNLASLISRAFGRENILIKAVRPSYERLLETTTRGRGYIRTFNGHESFYIDPHHRGYFPEAYEPAVCEFLRQRVKAGAVSLNIGAHVGFYAMCLARWSRPDGRVLAFEPNPVTRSVLASQVERNRLTAQIEIVSEAVSGEAGEAKFYAAEAAGFNRLGQPNPIRQEDHIPIRVPVTTIDAFCLASSISPDWLVMDIEGYEVAALDGGRKTIKAGRPHLGIVVEMHPSLWPLSGTSRSQFEVLLKDLRLRAVPLTGQFDPLAENGVAYLEHF